MTDLAADSKFGEDHGRAGSPGRAPCRGTSGYDKHAGGARRGAGGIKGRFAIGVTVLDNGLRSAGEHSYVIAHALRGELARRGCAMTSYAHRDVDAAVRADLGCVPHFTRGLYEGCPATGREQRWRNWISRLTFRPLDYGPSEGETARILNGAFAEDLARLPSDIWDAGNLVLFPGVMQHQLVGLADFVRRTPIAAKIVCQLMFQPSWLPWDRRARKGNALYRRALRSLRPLEGRTIAFTAENPHVARLFEKRFRLCRVSPLPVPLASRRVSAPGTAGIAIGFLGYSKAEKGFHLLPEAVRRCCAARSDLRFTIQVQHHGQEPAVVEAEKALRATPAVRIVDGALDGEAFAALSAGLDIALIPYDPQRFGMRGSGLFVEAVTSGRVVVASPGTWAGRSVAAGEAVGTVLAAYTGAALASAILAACAEWPKLRDEAIAKAAGKAHAYSIERYAELLFAAAGLAVPPVLAPADASVR